MDRFAEMLWAGRKKALGPDGGRSLVETPATLRASSAASPRRSLSSSSQSAAATRHRNAEPTVRREAADEAFRDMVQVNGGIVREDAQMHVTRIMATLRGADTPSRLAYDRLHAELDQARAQAEIGKLKDQPDAVHLLIGEAYGDAAADIQAGGPAQVRSRPPRRARPCSSSPPIRRDRRSRYDPDVTSPQVPIGPPARVAPSAPGSVFGRLKVAIAFGSIWLIVGAFFYVVISTVDHSNHHLYAVLDKRGVHARATVTRTAPNDHNTVYYTFTVSGTIYSSSDLADPPNPDASHLHVGDQIQIVYDIRDPHLSCACDPHAEKPYDQLFPVIVALFSATFFVGIYMVSWILRRNRQISGVSHESPYMQQLSVPIQPDARPRPLKSRKPPPLWPKDGA
ncbi:DUF3592 domain-containing protein [Actinomadura sp. RB99]|uniref:DUF3592 domain-containing protein n=1 Tax=Actinomadura sp. RB99 TaxID=2691577 RepID=UPI001688C815|nr:DUF3592 domain-containing protein [Actinomadura sp. RB99]